MRSTRTGVEDHWLWPCSLPLPADPGTDAVTFSVASRGSPPPSAVPSPPFLCVCPLPIMAATAFAAAPAGVCARPAPLASATTTSVRPDSALGVCAFTPSGRFAARLPTASAAAAAPAPPPPLPLSPVADGTVAFPSDLDGTKLRVGIVSARWRSDLTGPMVADVLRGLGERSVKEENIVQMEVPGCGELPVAARLMMASQKVDVVVAVGVLIEGATDGYSFMSEAVSQGLMSVRAFLLVLKSVGVLLCCWDLWVDVVGGWTLLGCVGGCASVSGTCFFAMVSRSPGLRSHGVGEGGLGPRRPVPVYRGVWVATLSLTSRLTLPICLCARHSVSPAHHSTPPHFFPLIPSLDRRMSVC